MLGSQLVCSSPRLIAAYHVLRRLPVPRHPPCALTRLISVSRCDSSTPQHTTRQLSKSYRQKSTVIERGKCGRTSGTFRAPTVRSVPTRRSRKEGIHPHVPLSLPFSH